MPVNVNTNIKTNIDVMLKALSANDTINQWVQIKKDAMIKEYDGTNLTTIKAQYAKDWQAYINKWLSFVGLNIYQVPKLQSDGQRVKNELKQIKSYRNLVAWSVDENLSVQSYMLDLLAVASNRKLTKSGQYSYVIPLNIQTNPNIASVDVYGLNKHLVESHLHFRPDVIQVFVNPIYENRGYIVLTTRDNVMLSDLRDQVGYYLYGETMYNLLSGNFDVEIEDGTHKYWMSNNPFIIK